jgi:hypothetical protein
MLRCSNHVELRQTHVAKAKATNHRFGGLAYPACPPATPMRIGLGRPSSPAIKVNSACVTLMRSSRPRRLWLSGNRVVVNPAAASMEAMIQPPISARRIVFAGMAGCRARACPTAQRRLWRAYNQILRTLYHGGFTPLIPCAVQMFACQVIPM